MTSGGAVAAVLILIPREGDETMEVYGVKDNETERPKLALMDKDIETGNEARQR